MNKPLPHGIILIAETGSKDGRGYAGAYQLSIEEQREVLKENERRGTLHLILERNREK